MAGIGNGNARKDVPHHIRDSVLTLWEAGDSVNAIVRKVGYGRTVVERVVTEGGHELEKRPAQGGPISDRPEVITGRGYIGVRVHPGDPHFAMRNGNYVLKHRLAMAQHLGRDLRDDEKVRHRNGDKSNNNLENLELHGAVVSYVCNDCGSTNIGPQD